MKNGDKLIWDTCSGYDVCYFSEVHNSGESSVKFMSGIGSESFGIVFNSELKQYSKSAIEECEKKYGYRKDFK